MNYIGSKQTLLPFIERVYRRVRDGDERTACDLFAGTGAVGRHFKRMGLRVMANDLQYYAYALNKAYLELNQAPRFSQLPRAERRPAPTRVECALTMLGRLPGPRGFIASNLWARKRPALLPGGKTRRRPMPSPAANQSMAPRGGA